MQKMDIFRFFGANAPKKKVQVFHYYGATPKLDDFYDLDQQRMIIPKNFVWACSSMIIALFESMLSLFQFECQGLLWLKRRHKGILKNDWRWFASLT